MAIDDSDAGASKTIPQFCRSENISPASYYKMKRLGFGPDELRVPHTEIVRITHDAHMEWRERMKELAATEEAELERQRRIAQRKAAGKSAARRGDGEAA